MEQYALVVGTYVSDVETTDTPPETPWVATGRDDVAIGWSYDGETFSPPPAPPAPGASPPMPPAENFYFDPGPPQQEQPMPNHITPWMLRGRLVGSAPDSERRVIGWADTEANIRALQSTVPPTIWIDVEVVPPPAEEA